jgi:pimeloyl-ACP methyl ester carboxylesterase
MALSPSVIRAFLSYFAKWRFWKQPHRQTFSEAAYSAFNRMPAHEQKDLHGKYVCESGRATAEIGLWPLDPRKASRVDASKVCCPVLTVVGSADRIIPPFSVRKVAAKYKATHKEYPDHAHWLMGEQGWEEIAGNISEWLKSVT